MNTLEKILVTVTLLILLSYHAQGADDWSSFRKNSLNRAVQEVEIFSPSPPLAFKTEGLVWGTPIIDEDEIIYVGSADKYFYAFDSSGKSLWKFEILGQYDSLIDSAAVLTSSGKIVVPGGDGYLYALDKTTGKLIWSFKAYHATDEQVKLGSLVNSFEGNVVQGPNGYLYAGSDNGYLYCLDETGREIWNFKTGMMIWSAPVFHPENQWLAFGSLDGYLYLLEPNKGELLDKKKLNEIKASPVYDAEKNLLFIGDRAGNMYAFQIVEQKIKKVWKSSLGQEIYSSVSYYQERIFFGSADGNFYCLDYQGNLIWKYNTYSAILSSPAIIKDKAVIFGAANGKLYALNFNGSKIWSFKTTDSPHLANLDSSPAVSKKGRIYIGSHNGHVYGLSFDYCLKNQDERCESGKTDDLSVKPGKILRFEDWNAKLSDNLTVGLAEPVKIRLVTFKDDKYLPNTAINQLSLHVSISPQVDFSYSVSGDGRTINIVPKEFWEPRTDYKINIKGEYYTKHNFFLDRLKWFFLPKFEQELTFSTKEAGELINFDGLTFNLEKISLFQPLSVNSLASAALGGQKFLVRFKQDNNQGFVMVLTPAFEKQGKFYKLNDSRQEITLNGKFKGRYFIAEGSPELSAMGAIIPLKKAIVSGEIINGKINQGTIYAQGSCLNLKGNLENYYFPYQLIDETCGSFFELIMLARFEARQQ